jgi:exonuclease SbcD
MIRVLHFSDLHLGSDYHGKPDPETGINQRVLDFSARLDELIEFATGNDVDLVLFAGDAFKNATPTPTVQKLLAERVWRLAKAGIRVFMLAGNHDLPRMVSGVTAFSVYPALEVENVTVAEQAGVYPIQTRSGEIVQIAAMPHFWRSAFTRHIETGKAPADIDREIRKMVAARVADLGNKINPSLTAILTAHCHVEKAHLSTAQDLYGISDFELSLSSIAHRAFPYVALGHIHKQQVLNDDWRSGTFAAYSGSLDRVDFGEEGEEKGFFVADFVNGRLSEEPRFVLVNARPFVTVKARLDAADATGSVLAAVARATVNDAVVRVQIEGPRDLYEEVDQSRVRAALAGAYEARIHALHPDETTPTVRDPRFAEAMSEAKALEEYVRTEHPKDAGELLRLGNELINEVLAQT